MSRRKLIWHIGTSDAPRPVVAANLDKHRPTLEDLGVHSVATRDEARLATHELLRTHREAGLARTHVEGRWARICDRVWQHKGVSLLCTPQLGAADKDQIRLALDALIGVEVHLMVTLDSFSQQIYGGWLADLRAGRTAGWEKYAARVLAPTAEHQQAGRFWAGHDVPAMLSRWGWTLRPDRLHVVADRDVGEHWTQLLDIAGLRDAGLATVIPAYADPAGVAVLRKVNRQLEAPLAVGTLDMLTGAEESAAMPVVPTGALADRVRDWATALAAAGHDLRGDLSALLDEGDGTPLPGPRGQLAAAVDALAEALAENTRLRGANEALEAAQPTMSTRARTHSTSGRRARQSSRTRSARSGVSRFSKP
jgi:hypothetical protein